MALVDLRLGDESGLDLLEPLLAQLPRLAVVVITAHASDRHGGRRDAAGGVRLPAQAVHARPGPRACSSGWRRSGGSAIASPTWRTGSGARSPRPNSQGRDPEVRRVLEMARRVAPSDAAVLIRGENGTGKGVLARTLHAWSKRADGPFVTVNCPSLSPDLLESDLFGHARGAFTGAVRDAAGKVAAAEGGTLFLDEVGDLPPPLQPKLLRFLQERKYERVGETQDPLGRRPADRRDQPRPGSAGRLGRIPRGPALPAQRRRADPAPAPRARTDILDLADHLLGFFARQIGRRLTGFTPEARAALARHPGRATSASSATPSSGPRSSPKAPRSAWPTSPSGSPSRPRPRPGSESAAR